VNFGRNLWIWAAVIVLLFVLFEMFKGSANPAGAQGVKYSDFLNKVEAGEVTNVRDHGP
jgi:cell division protease FtsH